MRLMSILTMTFLLASCGNDAQPVRDVQYFLNNPEALKGILEKCRNDPGNLEDTPNCINAEEASIQQMNANIRKARERMK